MGEEQGNMMDMARCLVQLATPATKHHKPIQNYECKTCRKSFTSSQALGGHRASHNYKKSRSRDQVQHENGNSSSSTNTSAKLKVHSCSVCGHEFSSGQALGGHMRKHRQLSSGDIASKNKTMLFDLNLPLVEDSDDGLNEDGSLQMPDRFKC